MRASGWPIVIALLLLCFGAPCLARAEGKEQSFELYPPGDALRLNPVKLTVAGEVFSPGFQYLPAAPGLRTDGLLDLLVRLSQAGREGTPDDVLPLWSPTEREAMRPIITSLFERNQALARTVVRSTLRARLLYGPFVLAVARHDLTDGTAIVSVYPVAREGAGYFLTDRLANDPVFAFLVTTLRERFQGPQ